MQEELRNGGGFPNATKGVWGPGTRPVKPDKDISAIIKGLVPNSGDSADAATSTSHLIGSSPELAPLCSSQVRMEARDVMSKDVATIRSNKSVLSAAKMMSESNISCIVVVDNANVKGIITETDLLQRIAEQEKDFTEIRVSEIMSSPVETIPSDSSILDAGKIMEAKRIKKLPILEENRLVGIITQTDLIQALTSYGVWSEIEGIMTLDVVGIQRGATVAEAAEVMASCRISSIVVLEAEAVVGILTERDLLKRVVAPQQDPACVKVEQIMSSPVQTIPSSYSVFSASGIMKKMHIRRLIVMDNKRLCGILTQTDIFRALERQLQAEEERNLRLLEEAENGVYTLNPEGRTVYVNPAFMKLLEVSKPGELINQPFLPQRFWFNPQDRNRFLRELKKGSVEISELTLKTSKGKRIYVTLFSTLTRDIHGQPNGSQGVLYDITAKKELVKLRKTQEALRASEQRHRRITDAVTDYIFTVRFKNYRPIETIHNPTSSAMTGYTPSELIGHHRTWLDIVHPEDRGTVRQQVCHCISGRDVESLEYRIIRKDSQIRWVKSTLVGHFDPKGKIISYDNLLQDITERREMHGKLMRKQKNIEAIFDAAPMGMLLVDENMIIKRANDSIKQMVCRDYPEIVNQRADDVLGCVSGVCNDKQCGDSRTCSLQKIIERTLDSNQAIHGLEIQPVLKVSDKEINPWLHISIEPTIIDGYRHVVVAIDDITEHKKAEEEKKAILSHLRQQEKLKSIGTLASGVAHEINNPLTNVINYAQLINDRTQDDPVKEFSSVIIDQSYRMAKIVRNLLSFSRRQKDKPQPAHIKDIVDVSLSLIGAVLSEDQITIEKDIPDDLPQVSCCSQQIEQVIINLLTNAKDAVNCRYEGYHEDKIIKIIARRIEQDDTEWVRTTIEDHGVGIPTDIIDCIFDPFFTSKATNEGTGLGLWVSYGIVKEHHGQFLVDSEAGGYTRFHLDLRVDNEQLLEDYDVSSEPVADAMLDIR